MWQSAQRCKGYPTHALDVLLEYGRGVGNTRYEEDRRRRLDRPGPIKWCLFHPPTSSLG